jgi:hypothetical protein
MKNIWLLVLAFLLVHFAAQAQSPTSSTKKFCEKGGWDYSLTISAGKFTIKCTPNPTNPYYKKKVIKPEVFTGVISNGKLLSRVQTGEIFELFKLKPEGLCRFYDEVGDYQCTSLCK